MRETQRQKNKREKQEEGAIRRRHAERERNKQRGN